jgi:hypothetical protein
VAAKLLRTEISIRIANRTRILFEIVRNIILTPFRATLRLWPGYG